MATQHTVRQVDTVPSGARVCHYDELEETGKHRFAEAVKSLRKREETCGLAADIGEDCCDVVKFTDYYLLERA
ncbi:hypothetical protein [Halobellus salinisoli]|uniref:hypothetical protein n=1 Tax=Halobellus salinisoli TaxID=3108500 RepID=UPI00300A782F